VIRRAALALVLLGVLAACRVDVTVDLTISDDGTGELAVTAVADGDVVEQAPGLAEDLRFDDAVDAGWRVEGPTTDDGGLTVTLTHPVTSAEEATNLLASLGPPFAEMRLERTTSADGEDTTVVLSGQLTLPDGFDSFADSELVAAVGGSPFADDLAAAGATPAGSMSAVFRARLPGEVEETNAREDDGALVWEAPLDGTASAVNARAVQRPSSGGWADVVSMIALVLLVLWIVASAAFIVSVARARSRRARARRRLARERV
jgi:hypothetical protein